MHSNSTILAINLILLLIISNTLICVSEPCLLILGYHHIIEKNISTNKIGNFEKYLYVTKENFEKQLIYLLNNGFKNISLEEWYRAVKNQVPLEGKFFAITFDDGYRDNYYVAYPILKKYNLTATFFIITSMIGEKHFRNFHMNYEELETLLWHGMEIGSHTVHHYYMKTITLELRQYEIIASKYFLEKLFNIKVKSFSYPRGVITSDIKLYLKKAGYVCAVTTRGVINTYRTPLLELGRYFPLYTQDVNSFAKSIKKILKFKKNIKRRAK